MNKRLFSILNFFVLSGFILFPDLVQAQKCKQEYISGGKNLELRIQEDCRIEIHPYLGKNRKRSYWFFADGAFQSFVETQDYNTVSKSMGATVYQLLPVKESKPAIRKKSDGTFEILTASGHLVQLNSMGELISINDNRVKTYPLQHIDKMHVRNGGIEISPFNGIFVNYGWAKGNGAYANAQRDAVIKDKRGRSCTVKNAEIYAPNPKVKAAPIALMKKPEHWKKFIKKRCSNLLWMEDTKYAEAFYGTKELVDADPIGDLIEKINTEGGIKTN